MEKLLRRLLDDQLSLELDLEAELDQVLADPAQVERLLLQSVSDARSAGVKGGRVSIQTRNVELDAEHGGARHVTLSVHDDQSSLTPEVALSAASDAGNAWLESEPGSGARFVACFPSVTGPRTSGVTRVETVLVVQDNPHLRKTLKTYFAREGFRVLDAGGSLEAMRLVEDEPRIDLLLTDFSLPDGSGPELGRALRQRLPGLKLLIATGHPEQRAALREDELTAVISKPFDLQQFGALVERLIGPADVARR
jgi:CheY-like chemotaxis protein